MKCIEFLCLPNSGRACSRIYFRGLFNGNKVCDVFGIVSMCRIFDGASCPLVAERLYPPFSKMAATLTLTYKYLINLLSRQQSAIKLYCRELKDLQFSI